MRDSAWRAFGRWLTQKDWSAILSASLCKEKFKTFMSELSKGIDIFLPYRAVKKHPTACPWITDKIKMWIRKHQATFIQQGKNSMAYRLWTNKVQCAIRTAKYYYYRNRVDELEQVNPEKWWREIQKLSGQDVKHDWHYQFLEDDMDIKSLANKINDYF